MIAASDPQVNRIYLRLKKHLFNDFQEYVPGGRQQALRHPGALEISCKISPGEDDFLSNKFKKVSLVEGKQNDWWLLRKVSSVSTPAIEDQDLAKSEAFNKSYIRQSVHRTWHSEVLDDSSCFRTGIESSFNKFGKRISDTSSSKTPNKRLSLDNEYRNDTKQGIDVSKSRIGE